MSELPTYSFGEVVKKIKADKESARDVNIALSDQQTYNLEFKPMD